MIPERRPRVLPTPIPSLAGRRLRISPEYRVLAREELDPQARELFDGLVRGGEYHGLLVPSRRPSLGLKAIDAAAAELLRVIDDTERLPTGHAETELDVQVARLVLDGVVEVETERGFATGPAATDVVAPAAATTLAWGATSALYCEALELASHVDGDDPRVHAAWLYGYNTMPLSPRWDQQLGPDDAAIERSLGLDEHGRNQRRIDPYYAGQRIGAWISWHRRHGASDGPCAYKLYVSPHPACFADAFDAIVATLVRAGVRSFKLGVGMHGLLRPDKLVAYVEDWPRLRAVARALIDELGAVEAQGVPFTAPLDRRGLLSWGMDPPAHARLPGWGTMESWRSWLTKGLARALIVARTWNLVGAPARDHALGRLRLEGVDPCAWLPAEDLWDALEHTT